MTSRSAKMWICTDHTSLTTAPLEADVIKYFEELKKIIDVRAYCGQLELSESGKYHYQYVVYLNVKQRMSYLKSKLPNAHFEICFDKKHSYNYCKKEDTRIYGPYEYGHFPFSIEQKTVINWEDVWNLAKRGNMDEIEPRVRIQYYTTLRKIYDFEQKPAIPHATTRGIWLHGHPGSFKSRFVMFFTKHYNDGIPGSKPSILYDKKIDKWWDLYDNRINSIACIDEVHPKCSLTFFHQLKTWADFRPFIADVKGGSSYPIVDNLFVTANYTLNECVLSKKPGDYINDEQLFFALRRRFIDINMSYTAGIFKYECIKIELFTPYQIGFISNDDLLKTPEVYRMHKLIISFHEFYTMLIDTTENFRIPRYLIEHVYSKAFTLMYTKVYDMEKRLSLIVKDEELFFNQECLFGPPLSIIEPIESLVDEERSQGTRDMSDISVFARDLDITDIEAFNRSF